MRLTILRRAARELFKSHGLVGWVFEFDRSVRRFGLCNYDDKKITMSKAMSKLNDEPCCMNTLLHEIAHALVGIGHGHNNVWRSKAVSIGCDGNRLYSTSNTSTISHKWVGVCSDCYKVVGEYHRRRNLYHRPCRNVNAPNRGKMIYREA